DKRQFNGSFGDHVADIEQAIGHDPAFIFVDPFGWKGAEIGLFERLVNHGNTPRDVLVNVMFDFMNRVKANPDPLYRLQLGEFFGLGAGIELPADLDEDGISVWI